MSIARQFLREFRPLFQMLEDSLVRSPAYYGLPSRSLFDDPFHSPGLIRPAVDVSEEGNTYIVEADLPGVKKENVEVRIGDGGRSVTIEGKIVDRHGSTAATEGSSSSEGSASAAAERSNQISTERRFTGNTMFTRTVWLPRPVDVNNVTAKLTDGILTLKVQKVEDKASVSIPID